MDLHQLGWNDRFEQSIEPFRARGLVPARVAVEHRSRFHLLTTDGELHASLAGRLRLDIDEGRALSPSVGDWVAVAPPESDGPAVIHAVLPRSSTFSRKAPLLDVEQTIAANVDVVFIITAADDDMSARRIERYLALTWQSGATPVVVISKSDLDREPAATTRLVDSVALGCPVLRVSSVSGEGLDALRNFIPIGSTVALLGSSGVGKSTLINALLGAERQRTGEVREDGKGRHTTTWRELVPLPGGGLLLDTPGMRELGLWDAEEGATEAFADIAALATECRFSDCRHAGEPDCAVHSAVQSGLLDSARLESWRKLIAELASLEARHDPEARAAAKRRARMLGRALQAHVREKYR